MTGITTDIGPRAGPMSDTDPLTTEPRGAVTVFSISDVKVVEVLVEVTSRSRDVEFGSISISPENGRVAT